LNLRKLYIKISGLDTLLNALAVDNPEIAPFVKGFQVVLKNSEAELENPETWKASKQTVLMIMGFIPQALPFIMPVSIAFDIIIASLEAENA